MSILSFFIDRRIEKYQNELIHIHYEEVENMYRNMRAWRHDLRNHLQVMKTYVDSGNIEAVGEYLQKLEADLTTVDTVIKTGNVMTDAILNSKISLARSKNIPVTADASIPVKLNLSEIDLCVIIGNLFDNAIEASLCLPESERMIRVYMDMKGTQLYISFTNLTATKKQSAFTTSKGDGHGFGLMRIDRTVEKLGGYVRRGSEDGAFTTEVLLPQAEV